MIFGKLHKPYTHRITPLEKAARAAARKRGQAARDTVFDTAVQIETQTYGDQHVGWFLRGWYEGR